MTKTLRQEIAALLETGQMSTRDIAQAVGIREKEVSDHLAHIFKSIHHKGKKLQTEPGRCRKCGFIFKERKRFNPPGRCPQCKSTYLDPPLYHIAQT